MVRSTTKYQAGEEEIRELFRAAGLGAAAMISPLGDGEFNAAYRVKTEEGKEYALKIAPPKSARVLTYERGMMASEVFWYLQMKEHTDILCPEIYYSDFSGNVIASSCFVMEMMNGVPLWAAQLDEAGREKAEEEKISMLTKIHGIRNDGYGYPQTGLHGSWYEALRAMAENLVKDCRSLGQETPDGERFLEYIDIHRETLKKAPCRMVNFDLWDSNILYDNGRLAWIDPERGFWGDPVADFVTLIPGQKAPLSQKQKAIEIYNRTAAEKIALSPETEVRYACAVAYLALVEEVEKYVRYEPGEPNYIRNTVDAGDMYRMAFSVLNAARSLF